MSAQEDAELVRRGYKAFIAGDMEWLNGHMHENVVWHVPGHNLTSGDYHGREAVLAFFARSVQIALPEFDIHDVVASDDHVVVLTTIRWRRNDNNETFEDHVGQVFHLDGGQVLEVWTMGEDLAGFDQFLEGVSG
jgi:ketosteroid isomerase-like protein